MEKTKKVKMVGVHTKIPTSLMAAVKVECARRGISFRVLLVQALETELKVGQAFQRFLSHEEDKFPQVAKSHGSSYYKGAARHEVLEKEKKRHGSTSR